MNNTVLTMLEAIYNVKHIEITLYITSFPNINSPLHEMVVKRTCSKKGKHG